ncbi:NAD-dependent dehydrogenase subunit [Geobacter metallireducens RCH3]|uniref:Ech-hydrogenase-related complex, large subunit n=1 Tax=Geobacter metallireducens (strain ATCC 53774 / DSM 7210 / GS-15) TaxID=269799 RepID=Q39YR0_GEOMG|nr:NADH-quinone oxidoreductase subunit C [Geobacter metallireducens]ABB30614.1 Ech-hydrogenase-related complex, large subunit [Geobacter metallireducens GS-15]EHP88001.1 NAD-dependent dehydrogenase subunit [Geobacter metallireducens RCH3]
MTRTFSLTCLRNGEAVPVASVPLLPLEQFLQDIIDATDRGWRVASCFGVPTDAGATLWCLMAAPNDGLLGLMRTEAGMAFPSICRLVPQLHLFEREIAEQCGITPEAHPWPKPVRFHHPFMPSRKGLGGKVAGDTDYYRVEGEEIHEVAVGPVHAGIIEPGHFRFQCHGEEVFSLEIALGYQHRGVEEGILKGPHPKTLFQMETIAGDTTIGHTLAYAMVMEALGGTVPSARAEIIRAISLELERLANHTGDLGALAGDVAYLPTASFCGRIRGDFLNMTAHICGSRFGRGIVRPGGVGFDVGERQAGELLDRLAAASDDLENAVGLLWDTQSVMARFEGTGKVSQETAREIGLVGPAARACGIDRDVRRDTPFGIYGVSPVAVAVEENGDVFARAHVRWREAEASLHFVAEQLRQLPAGPPVTNTATPAPDSVAVALTEGWRGEICHVAITDGTGRFARYKVVDPSFHNWTGLALALRNQQISDFPLCNKSFNLSYCGFDL